MQTYIENCICRWKLSEKLVGFKMKTYVYCQFMVLRVCFVELYTVILQSRTCRLRNALCLRDHTDAYISLSIYFGIQLLVSMTLRSVKYWFIQSKGEYLTKNTIYGVIWYTGRSWENGMKIGVCWICVCIQPLVSLVKFSAGVQFQHGKETESTINTQNTIQTLTIISRSLTLLASLDTAIMRSMAPVVVNGLFPI